MKKPYTVFSAHHLPGRVTVTLPDETQTTAVVDTLEVQLLPQGDAASGTLKLVVAGAAIKEAEALFAKGAAINVEFSGA